jgi:MoaA/NifB/PqqE/SkfB family radical SAM enzyme
MITEAQIFITRKCNSRCKYCALTQKNLPERELTTEEWKRAFSIMDDIGIKTLKILGGEPTVLDDLPEILRFLNEETDIDYAILSNSIIPREKLERLVEIGLRGYYASLDNTDGLESVGNYSTRKSYLAIDILDFLKQRGVKILGANTVIHRGNLRNLPVILEFLTKMGVWMNICAMHYGNGDENINWIFRSEYSELALRPEDTQLAKEIMEKLKQMKHAGYMLACPDSYLDNFPEYGINLSWKCREFSQLRVDADGSLLLCPDLRGKMDRFNILEIDDGGEGYLHEIEEPQRTLCTGCYWSSMYRAEVNKKIGGEFQFLKEIKT